MARVAHKITVLVKTLIHSSLEDFEFKSYDIVFASIFRKKEVIE